MDTEQLPPSTEEGVVGDVPTDESISRISSFVSFITSCKHRLSASVSQLYNTLKQYPVHSSAGIFVILLFFVWIIFSIRTSELDPAWITYSERYRLVPETISQSAYIPVRIPEGAGMVTSEQVTFTPQILGTFVAGTQEDVLLYKPKELPELGSFYQAELTYGSTTVNADFQIVEDPAILSILPVADSEVHEDTDISIIFNRPMVPLSTRGEMNKNVVPVTLSPDVPGIWKWKSTRLLQFIPDDTLAPATHYTVTVNEGFRSIDGVTVPNFTHEFTTRTLKHSPLPDSVRFNAPLEITFNQPIDLKRTASEITLTKDGKRIEHIVQYAEKEKKSGFLGLVLFGKKDNVDTTKLWVQPRADEHGREGFWDFESQYSLTIQKQYPLDGELVGETPITWNYLFPSVLNTLSAVSERSKHVEPTFFDPQGELVASFFEPIDISRTKLELRGVQEVRYGTQCMTDSDGKTIRDPETKECKTEENKSELRIRVKPDAYKRGDNEELTFTSIVSTDGYELTRRPLSKTVTVVPPFSVTRTDPEDASTNASLTSLIICSNTPLKRPESVRDILSVGGYIVYPNGPWSNSYRVGSSQYRDNVCKSNEFQTTIRYGLHPEQDYTLSLTLTDEFGEQLQQTIHTKTERAPSTYTRFHNLQQYYNTTIPGKTRLTYAVENLPNVSLHICKVSPETMLRILETTSEDNTKPPTSGCYESKIALLDLPDTYWVNNYFYFDIADYFQDTRGHYIITFTSPEYRNDKGVQQYDRTLLSVSNITVGEKRINYGSYEHENASRTPTPSPKSLYWVLNANTLEPIEGATVSSYTGTERYGIDDTISILGTATTDGQGVARTISDPYTTGAVVRHGNDTAVVSARIDTLHNAWAQPSESRTYLYTDRPIYKPGDTVAIRGIDRVGYDQSWLIDEGHEATVRIVNSRDDTVTEQTVQISQYGTFTLSFTLPPDSPLGSYRIETLGSYGFFEVEEYEGAPFKVTVEAQENEYIAGDDALFTFDAQYYFGMPVADATVEYTVLAQDYHFDRYQDEYFNFGRGWYTCYWCGYGDSFITRGTEVLDENGRVEVTVPLDFAKHFDDPEEEGSKLYTVIARITDKSGKQVTGQQTAIVHRGAFYLGVKTERYFAEVNQDIAVRVKSVDTTGAEQSLSDITLTVSKVEWESYKRREVDGGYYWHSEEKRTVVHSEKLSTDKQGNAKVSLRLSEPGSYTIAVTRTDKAGNTVVGETRFYVSGVGTVSVQETNNATLAISSDKPNYKIGEEATVLVESPFTTARALFTVERGDIYTYWTKPVSSSLITQTIPLLASYAPNVYASALLVGPGPDVKYGSVELRSGTDVQELHIETKPDKDHYLPGEDIALTVTTRNASGEPVSAEVSIAVVDLSVLALVGNPKKDPAQFFYGDLSLGVSTAHSAKNMLIQHDIPIGTKGGGGGGGDELERRRRGIFKDTAYFTGNVVTNEAGIATVRFTMPDNLTTWQIETLGVTKDTKLGVGYTEFMSSKKLMAIPIRPRFVIPGDTTYLGIQVANNTEEDATVRVHIESSTLSVEDTKEEKLNIKAGTTEVIYFKTTVPTDKRNGIHVASFYAVSETHEDVVEQVIPILEDKTMEVTATAGMTSGAQVIESILIPDYALENEGGLTVRARPTLVASMLSAVKEMHEFPYGCTEQIASRLASLTAIKKSTSLFGEDARTTLNTLVFNETEYATDDAIRAGLTTLLGRQHYEGGFSFYENTAPSLYLTTEVLYTLTVLRDAGYTVPDSVFTRATEYIIKELSRSQYYEDDVDMLARVTFALASPYIPSSYRTTLEPRVNTLVSNSFKMENISSTALGYLVVGTNIAPYESDMSDTFFEALVNRVSVDARGAYVKNNASEAYVWFASPEKNTAMLLHAIAQRGGEHPLLDMLLRWLSSSKRAHGGWGSTNATFTVLDAVFRLATVRNEQDASYVLSLLHNDEKLSTHTVEKTTLLEEFLFALPLQRFSRERIEQIILRKEGEGTMYYDMELRYALPPDLVPPRDEGITVERTLTLVGKDDPIESATVGDLVEGVLEITIPDLYRAVSIESFVPAGFEIVNFSFATEESRDLTIDDSREQQETLPYRFNDPQQGLRNFPTTYQEFHNDRVFAFAETVSPGTYRFTYMLRAIVPGTYRHMPAIVQEMYRPEIFGRTAGGSFTIEEK